MTVLVKRTSVILLGLIIIIFFGGLLWINPGRGPREPINPEAKGWRESVNGTLVLHLKGTPYEMGYQRGYFAKDKILQSISIFDGLLDKAKEEVGLPRFAAHLILDITYQLCAPHIPERYKREMEGMADASGADLKTLRRAHVISVITERGCSAFTVWGKATADGALYHGRNFDWITSAGLEDTAVLLLYEPDGFHKFASAGYAGMIGVLSGMNMEGISISMIGAVTDDKSLRGLPLEFVHRRILEESANLEEVTKLMHEINRTVGFNYVIADGDVPDARVYETTANHLAIFQANDPKETVEYAVPIEDAAFRSDEAMDPVVRSLQRCANAPNMPYGSNSYDHRYLGMVKGIQDNYGVINAEIALEILKSTAMENANLHAVLTNSTERIMWVAHAANGQNASLQPFIYYDLHQLFLPPEQRTDTENPIAIAAPKPETVEDDTPPQETAPTAEEAAAPDEGSEQEESVAPAEESKQKETPEEKPVSEEETTQQKESADTEDEPSKEASTAAESSSQEQPAQ